MRDGPSGGENQAADSGLQFFHCTSFCTEMATIHSLELASLTGSVSDLPGSESPRFSSTAGRSFSRSGGWRARQASFRLRALRYGGQVAKTNAHSERSGASSEERAERSEPGGVQGTPPIQERKARPAGLGLREPKAKQSARTGRAWPAREASWRARQDSNLRPPA